MSGIYDRELATLDYIEDLLEAYATARLHPTDAALARVRRAFMAKAAASAKGRLRVEAGSAARRSLRLPKLRVPARAVARGVALEVIAAVEILHTAWGRLVRLEAVLARYVARLESLAVPWRPNLPGRTSSGMPSRPARPRARG